MSSIPTSGLRLVTNNEINTSEESQLTAEALSMHTESRLAGYVRKVWERNRRARLNIDDRLLYDLRSRRGEYSPSELNLIVANGGADPVYLKLTGTKCRAASSWIRDIFFPAGEKPWAISPTTLPDMPPEIDQAQQQAALQHVQQGIQEGWIQNETDVAQFAGKIKDETLKLVVARAKKAAERMEDKIEDIMEEGDWVSTLEEFIEDFVTYPTAFLKGPFIKKTKKLEWGPDFKPVESENLSLHWKRVSPFDMYPAPHSRNLQGEIVERIRMTRSALYDLIGVPGYKEDEIREVLRHFDKGTIKDWIWEDFERERLESDTTYFTSEPDTIDALHYWGRVKGDLLVEWGMDPENMDMERPYEIEAILIGRNVIRAQINDEPLGARPYHYACWDPVPGSIWGISLPEQMEDHQKIVNACTRALCMNMAISSGPQVTIMTDQLAPGEDISALYPFKIWQMKSLMSGASSRDPVTFFQPNLNSEALLGVLNTFEQKADDVTNVPRYSYGNEKIGGAGSTASGLSMLLNSAAKGIRRAISHIDANVIRPTVYQTFIHVMLHDPDITIKGDVDIIPKGSVALLIKDQTQVRVQTFLTQTANPIDMQIIGPKGRAALLRMNAKLLDLPVDDIVPSDEDVLRQQLQAQQAQQSQMQQEAALEAQGQGGQSSPGPGGQASPEAPSAQAMMPGNQSQILQNKVNGPALSAS